MDNTNKTTNTITASMRANGNTHIDKLTTLSHGIKNSISSPEKNSPAIKKLAIEASELLTHDAALFSQYLDNGAISAFQGEHQLKDNLSDVDSHEPLFSDVDNKDADESTDYQELA